MWLRCGDSEGVLVFVHGRGSNCRDAWLYENKKDNTKTCYWPNLIASDRRFKDISIYLAGYDTGRDTGPYGTEHCATDILAALQRERDDDPRCAVMDKKKITFVCHSMGGNVVRYLLERNYEAFTRKQVGLVLISSPSYGSIYATFLNLMSWFLLWFLRNEQHRQLGWGTSFLRGLDERFKELRDKKRIRFLYGVEFCETHVSICCKWIQVPRVVTPKSAWRYFYAPQYISRTSHRTISKPRSPNDDVHVKLYDFLRQHNLLPRDRADKIYLGKL